jgi:hypothetical protein
VTVGGRLRIVLLSGLLLVGAASLTTALPRPHPTDTSWVLLVGLALLVAAAEFLQVRFRVGRQVDGSNLVEAVLTPLLVIAPDASGLLAVAAGQLLAGVLRRHQPL